MLLQKLNILLINYTCYPLPIKYILLLIIKVNLQYFIKFYFDYYLRNIFLLHFKGSKNLYFLIYKFINSFRIYFLEKK